MWESSLFLLSLSVHQTTIAGPDGKTTAARHYYLKSLLLGEEVGADFREALVKSHSEMPNSECIILLQLVGGAVSGLDLPFLPLFSWFFK